VAWVIAEIEGTLPERWPYTVAQSGMLKLLQGRSQLIVALEATLSVRRPQEEFFA